MTEQKSEQRRMTLISDKSRKSELYFLLFSAFKSEVKSELNQNFKTFVYRKTEQIFFYNNNFINLRIKTEKKTSLIEKSIFYKFFCISYFLSE